MAQISFMREPGNFRNKTFQVLGEIIIMGGYEACQNSTLGAKRSVQADGIASDMETRIFGRCYWKCFVDLVEKLLTRVFARHRFKRHCRIFYFNIRDSSSAMVDAFTIPIPLFNIAQCTEEFYVQNCLFSCVTVRANISRGGMCELHSASVGTSQEYLPNVAKSIPCWPRPFADWKISKHFSPGLAAQYKSLYNLVLRNCSVRDLYAWRNRQKEGGPGSGLCMGNWRCLRSAPHIRSRWNEHRL